MLQHERLRAAWLIHTFQVLLVNAIQIPTANGTILHTAEGYDTGTVEEGRGCGRIWSTQIAKVSPIATFSLASLKHRRRFHRLSPRSSSGSTRLTCRTVPSHVYQSTECVPVSHRKSSRQFFLAATTRHVLV